MLEQNRRYRSYFVRMLASLIRFTCLISMIASLPASAQEKPLKVAFGEQGPARAIYQDKAVKLDSKVVVREVKLTDTYRHPHEEIDPTSLEDAPLPGSDRRVGMRDYHDDRTFEDGDATPNKQSFDRSSQVLSQQYDWGVLRVKYKPVTNGIEMSVKVNNTSDQVIEHLSVELLSFQPPGKLIRKRVKIVPGGAFWIKGKGWMFSADTGANIGAPRILRWLYEDGKFVLFSPSPAKPLSYRLTGGQKSVSVVADLGQLPSENREVYDQIFNLRPIRAGRSDTFDVTLRFGKRETHAVELAPEAVRYFRQQKYPHMLDWPDRRPISATFVAGSGNLLRDGNPNGYRMAPDGWSIDDENAMETFRKSVIEDAEDYADRLVKLGYQGVVVWNISGEQYQSAKYYGEPRLVEYLAPEMDQVADDYFRILREHGLRVGVTIRALVHGPADSDGNFTSWENIEKLEKKSHNPVELFEKDIDTYLNPRECSSVLARLHHKIKYAKERWGATMFYIDYPGVWRPRTPGNWEPRLISPGVYRKLMELHPDILLMPEYGNLGSWSATATYGQVPKTDNMTPDPIRWVYPEAFSVRALKNVSKLNEHKKADQFAQGLREGDLPMAAPQFQMQETARYLEPIQSDTPYLVWVDKNELSLRGRGIDEEISLSSIKALQKTLANRLNADAPVVERRVWIRFDEEVDPGRVRALADAIGNGNGIVSWSEPVSSDKSND